MIAAQRAGMPKKTILIIEDHGDCRELLSIVLKRAGFVVEQAGTGLEGMERATAVCPDVIVMDYGLPDLLGDKMIKSLKANAGTKHVPVIVTTGYMNTEITQRAVAAGAARVLIKPYDVERLLAVIDSCLADGELPATLGANANNLLDAN